VAERTFAWLGRSRRLSKGDERRTDSSECQIRISALHHPLKRLTRDKPQPDFQVPSGQLIALFEQSLTSGTPEATVRAWVGHVDRDTIKL
jgi:hypothetical protein